MCSKTLQLVFSTPDAPPIVFEEKFCCLLPLKRGIVLASLNLCRRLSIAHCNLTILVVHGVSHDPEQFKGKNIALAT